MEQIKKCHRIRPARPAAARPTSATAALAPVVAALLLLLLLSSGANNGPVIVVVVDGLVSSSSAALLPSPTRPSAAAASSRPSRNVAVLRRGFAGGARSATTGVSSSPPPSSWQLLMLPEDDSEDETETGDEDDEEELQPKPQEAEVEVEVVTDSLTLSQKESLRSNTPKVKFNRESLGKLGVSAMLAYGFVSNVSGVVAVSCAWFIFSKKTGLSPLANKPAFLGIYAGFTVALNVIRPARFALSVAISPYFERIRRSLQRRFGVGPRRATGLVVVFANLLGTSSLMALGVGLASALSGVPVWGVASAM